MKYVITNADDFGYRSDISQAIIDAHLHGCLTSTSVLINFLTSEDLTIALANPTLGYGLHLNITSGIAISDNWKSKYGEFSRPYRNQPQQFDQEVWIPFMAKFETPDIYLEFKSQVEKFIQMFGKYPDHVDTHHYISAFTKVFPALMQIAKDYNLPVRQQVVFDFAANQHPMGNITAVSDLNQELIHENIITTDYFSLLYFNRFAHYLTQIKQELAKIKEGESMELSFHPGTSEDWRKKDLQILQDESVRGLFHGDFKLIKFTNL
jgi:predicted glycoside hydrolase/deacetylase ChbG (UPF0249 family)